MKSPADWLREQKMTKLEQAAQHQGADMTQQPEALQPEQQQEPVAIDRSDAVNLARNLLEVRNFKGITSYGVRVLCEAVMKMDAALYTRPQAQQKPLTDDEIARALASAGLIPEDYREDGQIEPLVRAIERSHGIKGAP